MDQGTVTALTFNGGHKNKAVSFKFLPFRTGRDGIAAVPAKVGTEVMGRAWQTCPGQEWLRPV